MASRISVVVAAVMVAGQAFIAGGGVAAQGQNDATVKGVYREAQRTGVKVSVFRGTGGSRTRVSPDFEFKSGDAFELELETNRPSYVYVLNRTLSGEPSELSRKGIERIRDEDRRPAQRARDQYKLLYPLGSDPKTTAANQAFRLPVMKMDSQPGVEKMFIVVSEKPIKIADYFDVSGDQRGRTSPPPSAGRDTGGDRHVDAEDDVLNQLNKNLVAWKENSETALPKGVVRDSEGYGVVRDTAKPGMVEVSLQHHRR